LVKFTAEWKYLSTGGVVHGRRSATQIVLRGRLPHGSKTQNVVSDTSMNCKNRVDDGSKLAWSFAATGMPRRL
jgi:hypothetical protein